MLGTGFSKCVRVCKTKITKQAVMNLKVGHRREEPVENDVNTMLSYEILKKK